MAILQKNNLTSPQPSGRENRRYSLLTIPIARRVTFGFLLPTLLAALALAGSAFESRQLLLHVSTLYQHLTHAYTTLNADVATLDQMHSNLLGALNDANHVAVLPQTLEEDQNILHQLENTFASTLDSYNQDVLSEYGELSALFTKTGHQSQIEQQAQLMKQVRHDWQDYQLLQENVLSRLAQKESRTLLGQDLNTLEQAYATTKTDLLNLITFNDALVPSIHDAIQLDETELLILLVLTGLSVVLAICIVGLLVFKTVVGRLHKVRATITSIEGGQIERRLPVEGRDEIASLSDSVNSMLDRIVGLLDETTRQRDELANAEELKRLHAELQAQHEVLNEANARLAALATTDPLTCLPNHRAVMTRIDEELGRARRTQQAFTLLFLDVDHFKHINDTWGHRAGDAVLREIARRLEQNIRVEDFAGRYGGEEFTLLLTNTDTVEDARKAAERLRQSIADTPCLWENEEAGSTISIPVTASFGIAVYFEHATIREALLEAADAAMYYAKRSGRNRVCVVGEESAAIEHLIESEKEQQDGDVAALRALVAVANVHDEETGARTQRIVQLAVSTARELGCSHEEQHVIRLAALLYDIGKIGIPDEILHKPGPLNEDEWAIMRRHPKIGHHILAQAGGKFELLSHIVIAHHERWDGKGYPYGLSQEMIPLGARILTVVDSFDAMTSDCPYRNALSEQVAREELRHCAGTQYDPQVVAAFFRVLDNEQQQEASSLPTTPSIEVSQQF